MEKIDNFSYEELLKQKRNNQVTTATLTSVLSFLVIALRNAFFLPSIWFVLRNYTNSKKEIEQTMAETDADVKLLYGIYKEILENTYKTINTLDASNPVDVYSYFCSMFKHGCFSYDFNNTHPLKILPLKDITLGKTLSLNGHGVCRHISVFLQELYLKFGYESDIAIGHINEISTETLYEYVEFCKNQTGVTREEIDKKFIIDFLHPGIFSNKFYKKNQKYSNHAVPRVNFDGMTLMTDPIHSCILYSVIADIFFCPKSFDSGVSFVLNRNYTSSYNKFLNIQEIKEHEQSSLFKIYFASEAAEFKAKQAGDVFDAFHKDNLPALEEAENLTQKVLQKKY